MKPSFANTKSCLWFTVGGLLILHFCMGWVMLRHAAPTADEYSYISTAYLYTSTGDFRVDRTHPPLLRLLMGVPLQFIDIDMPPLQQEKWDTPESNVLGYIIGWDMLLSGVNDWRYILTYARLPILLLSCALGLLLFLWGQRLYGAAGGLLTLYLYCFSPNMLAHAALATMDLGISFFFAAVLYAFYCYTQTPHLWKLIVSGLLLGFALCAKVTGLLLIPPLLMALFCCECKRYESWRSVSLKRFMAACTVLMVCAAFSLMLVYGYPVKPLYYWDTLQNVLLKSTQAGGAEYVPGMPHQNYAFYLFGEYSTSGWFYYYFIALLAKTPLAVFALLLLIFCFSRERWKKTCDVLIVGTILTLLILSMLNKVNIGLRHILPLYPLLFLYAGRAAHIQSKYIKSICIPILLMWYAAASIWISPHYLAYYNEAVGGPANAQFILDDSNIDWGQDLAALRDVQKEYPNETLYAATNWMFQPAAFDLDAVLLTPEQIPDPPKGIIAVGKHWAIRQRVHARSPYYFDWFETYTPIGHIGHSILIYRFE